MQLENKLSGRKTMFRALLIAGFVICVVLTSGVYAQDAAQKTRELVAALDKTKYKKKEKKDIKIEIYVDVKNEAVVKQNPAEYSGRYESLEPGYSLEIRVGQDGTATGSGYDTTNGDDSRKMDFTLKDAHVEGALLTAIKVYENGQTEKLQAVFSERTVSRGTNPSNVETTDSKYGIGFIQSSGSWTNRVFLEFRQ